MLLVPELVFSVPVRTVELVLAADGWHTKHGPAWMDLMSHGLASSRSDCHVHAVVQATTIKGTMVIHMDIYVWEVQRCPHGMHEKPSLAFPTWFASACIIIKPLAAFSRFHSANQPVADSPASSQLAVPHTYQAPQAVCLFGCLASPGAAGHPDALSLEAAL